MNQGLNAETSGTSFPPGARYDGPPEYREAWAHLIRQIAERTVEEEKDGRTFQKKAWGKDDIESANLLNDLLFKGSHRVTLGGEEKDSEIEVSGEGIAAFLARHGFKDPQENLSRNRLKQFRLEHPGDEEGARRLETRINAFHRLKERIERVIQAGSALVAAASEGSPDRLLSRAITDVMGAQWNALETAHQWTTEKNGARETHRLYPPPPIAAQQRVGKEKKTEVMAEWDALRSTAAGSFLASALHMSVDGIIGVMATEALKRHRNLAQHRPLSRRQVHEKAETMFAYSLFAYRTGAGAAFQSFVYRNLLDNLDARVNAAYKRQLAGRERRPLDAPRFHDVSNTLLNRLEDRRANPVAQEQPDLDLAILHPRDREVIEMRFGFGGEEPKTLEEVGEKLGVTRERARQIEARALHKLRAAVDPEHAPEAGTGKKSMTRERNLAKVPEQWRRQREVLAGFFTDAAGDRLALPQIMERMGTHSSSRIASLLMPASTVNPKENLSETFVAALCGVLIRLGKEKGQSEEAIATTIESFMTEIGRMREIVGHVGQVGRLRTRNGKAPSAERG